LDVCGHRRRARTGNLDGLRSVLSLSSRPTLVVATDREPPSKPRRFGRWRRRSLPEDGVTARLSKCLPGSRELAVRLVVEGRP
jgi:hypothetical protein